MTTPQIQWYPGHIAKAERALQEQLKLVDVVLEVRDARIPFATSHPQVAQWVGSKGRVLVLNRVDMIPTGVQQEWVNWFHDRSEQPFFTNANHGAGVTAVAEAAKLAGEKVNQRRHDRGMLPRPIRAVVIGFPNVGKSALINRLLNRRVVVSARRAGITRQLRWVRISDQLELLDAPGVLPSKLKDQDSALKLAICDDIGEAAYDTQLVAAGFVDLLNQLQHTSDLKLTEGLRSRYRLNPAELTGASFLETLAIQRHQGDVERTARELLNDYRKGLLGSIPLELPAARNIAVNGN